MRITVSLRQLARSYSSNCLSRGEAMPIHLSCSLPHGGNRSRAYMPSGSRRSVAFAVAFAFAFVAPPPREALEAFGFCGFGFDAGFCDDSSGGDHKMIRGIKCLVDISS